MVRKWLIVDSLETMNKCLHCRVSGHRDSSFIFFPYCAGKNRGFHSSPVYAVISHQVRSSFPSKFPGLRRKRNFHPGVSPKYCKEARVVPRESLSQNVGKFPGQKRAGIQVDGGLGSELDRKPSRGVTQMEWDSTL